MKSSNKYLVNVITTGFVTLVILSVLFFWLRKTCRIILYENMIIGRSVVGVRPSGLTLALDNAPDVAIKSSIKAHIRDGATSHSFGIVQDIWSLKHGKIGKFFRGTGKNGKGGYEVMLFDKESGLFVYYDVMKQKRGWKKKAKLYAGPKGISKTADKNLGRFSEPRNNLWRGYADSVIFFDKLLPGFFKIRFHEKTVVKSRQLPKDYSPVQIGYFDGLYKNVDSLGPSQWSPPMREKTAQDIENKKRTKMSKKRRDGQEVFYVSAAEKHTGTYSTEYSLILDISGEIRKLDNKTLELSIPVAHLKSNRLSQQSPENLFAYSVQPLIVNNEYAGTITGGISREALGLQVAVFDANGKQVEQEAAEVDFDEAGGPLLVVIAYILENLQAPILGVASYFTGNVFEAASGHKALFILPNSFVSMLRRDKGDAVIARFFFALVIMSPSLLLSIWLVRLIRKDATTVGLSGQVKLYWTIGTILFGISAYVTYRLTRPKDTLVTCQNCGKLRRPDSDRCHRCGSKWFVPELRPPTWRVISTG